WFMRGRHRWKFYFRTFSATSMSNSASERRIAVSPVLILLRAAQRTENLRFSEPPSRVLSAPEQTQSLLSDASPDSIPSLRFWQRSLHLCPAQNTSGMLRRKKPAVSSLSGHRPEAKSSGSYP